MEFALNRIGARRRQLGQRPVNHRRGGGGVALRGLLRGLFRGELFIGAKLQVVMVLQPVDHF